MPLRTTDAHAVWQAMPVSQAGRYTQFSSRDPELQSAAGIDFGNKDFNNFLAICGERPALRDQTVGSGACDPGLAGYLIAADDGPGVVTRLFFPATQGDPGFGDERIRIYVDDLVVPAYEGKLLDWRQGRSEPFVPPLTEWTSGALVTHLPIVYQHTLRVLLDDLRTDALMYYQVDVQRGVSPLTLPVNAATTGFQALQALVSSASDASDVRSGDWTAAPGATVAILDERGHGTVLQLRCTVHETEQRALEDLSLRMTWDDATTPAVELPLSVLFGSMRRPSTFETMPLSLHVQTDSLELTWAWPMPFFQRARIELINSGTAAHGVSVRAALSREQPEPAAGYFHAAAQHRRGPFSAGDRYRVASLHGEGQYVGTLVTMRGGVDPDSATPYPLGFLEGDERFVIDGQTASQGTGTEDYFDAGWYFRDGLFHSPFGALIDQAVDDASQSASVCMARWHILQDTLAFHSSLELSFEYGANRPRSALEYSSVAFYYGVDPQSEGQASSHCRCQGFSAPLSVGPEGTCVCRAQAARPGSRARGRGTRTFLLQRPTL